MSLPVSSDAPSSPTLADPRDALKEMADLESQIEAAQRQQFEEQRRLLEASRSLNSVDSTLQQKTRLNQEGEQFLQQYDAQARARLNAAEQQLAADRRKINAARGALALTGTRLYAAGAANVSVPVASLLALGLLHDMQHNRGATAMQESQDLEARRSELAGKREHAQRSTEYQTVFSQYSLQQLRERHQALALQVSEAQAQADEQSQQVRQLASRREELKNLIAKLAEQETGRAAEPTPAPDTTASIPSPSATPAPTPSVVASLQRPHPALPPSSALTGPTATPLADAPPTAAPAQPAVSGALAEVPYENGSEPMASAMRASSGDKDQTDASGTRYLFWRARPVGVCALAPGKVIFSGPFAGYRHLLIIDHGSGWRSLYGNMVHSALTVGDHVVSGQSLGEYQAVQGSRAEPLWYEVRQGTQAVAPETWSTMPSQWQSRLFSQLQAQATR